MKIERKMNIILEYVQYVGVIGYANYQIIILFYVNEEKEYIDNRFEQ